MTRSATSHPLLADVGYPALKQFIIDATGLAYYSDKDDDLASRIGHRLAHVQIGSCAAYLNLLRDHRQGEPERHALVEQLTIGETYFFRHIEQLDAITSLVFAEALERNRLTRTLRVWSAGCAIGAEPYSVAILLKQHFGDQLVGWNVRILGTDINRSFLAAASRGAYGEHALRSTPDGLRREWFTKSAAGWTIDDGLRSWVTFRHHNLLDLPYGADFSDIDVILCRNVMIYFDWALNRRILDGFHDCLVDGGWLAPGHAECNPDLFRAFHAVNAPGATLYQKVADGQAPRRTSYQPYFTLDAPPAGLAEAEPWTPPALPAVVERQQLTRTDTSDIGALALVRRLADEGKWGDAARTCERALERDARNARLHFYRALIAEHEGQAAVAERALRSALAIDHGLVLAHYHLALILDKRDRRDDARRSMAMVLTLLQPLRRTHAIPEGDGMTASDLEELVRLHLTVMTP